MKKLLRLFKFILPIILAVVLLQLVSPIETHAAPPAGGGGVHHIVRYGETLFSIGRLYGVNPYYIARVNRLPDPNYIYAGQVLYIPSGRGYPSYPKYGYAPPCHNKCGYPKPVPYGGYGYDYSGYYYYSYYPKYQRYSYTCGYYYYCY